MLSLYNDVCMECSRLITQRYSTSFSLGIRVFDAEFRPPIYAVYGFVRFADEIVDTFHDFPKRQLLDRFREDTYRAIDEGVSLNPVLHSFQQTARKYGIGRDLIDPFLESMEMDLDPKTYNDSLYSYYIYGSAEVVGLMCLKVFCEGDQELYASLEAPAKRLGAAFQKVNFLRDMRSDFLERGRVYFPGVDYRQFSLQEKQQIEDDIHADFKAAYEGIIQLPKGARFGVYLAYVYYLNLFKKIRQAPVSRVKEERIRVGDSKKLYLLASSALRSRLKML